ncbi:unnamed protein product, partial [Coregonus sp. 'balchen']
MSKIELLRLFLNERLTAAADEIFGTIEKTIVEYQEEVSRTKEENNRLRRLLRTQLIHHIFTKYKVRKAERTQLIHHIFTKYKVRQTVRTQRKYQEEISRSKEENNRLQNILDIVIKPEIKLQRA